MKRLYSIILCMALISSMIISVCAATSVPAPVMNAKKSVVRVLAEYSDGYATGSGFVVVSDSMHTLLVTNYHVVGGNPYSISVWIGEEEQAKAGVVAYSEQKDLCILRLDYPVALEALSLSNNGAKQGDAVYAVGFPSAADYLFDKEAHTSDAATITDGIVSAVREATILGYGSPVTILQISAAINAGNSGGPLFNSKGEVVGVNTYGIVDSQGIFGAIDVLEVKQFLNDYGIKLPFQVEKNVWVILAVLVTAFVAGMFFVVRKKAKHTTLGIIKNISMRTYMEKHPNGLGVFGAVDLLFPVAVQLRDLHSVGSCHLQISPDTIIIGKKGAYLKKATTEEFLRYTNGYAAPEVYKGNPASIFADIYSFSALLHYAAIGKHPENAMSREEEPNEKIFIPNVDEDFQSLIDKGLALDAVSRFASMQELIVRLLPFKSNPSIQAKHTTHISRPQKKLSKKGLAVVIISVIIGLQLFGGVGTYICAINGQYTVAGKLLLISPVLRLTSGNLSEYIHAGQLMEQRNYTAAKQIYVSLSGYLNADALSQDADYRYTLQCADRNDFSTAIQIAEQLEKGGYPDGQQKLQQIQFCYATYLLYDKEDYKTARTVFLELVEKEYPGAQEMADETLYLWALYQIDQGDYKNAYGKLNAIRDYSDVNEAIEALTELMYREAQSKYHVGKYSEANTLFLCIPKYKDSNKYISLITLRNAFWVSQDDVNKLINLFNFEDASEVLLVNHAIAKEFLKGTWRGDGHYFTMREDGYISYSLPRINYGHYYRIEDGNVLLYPKDNYNSTKKCFKITAITSDSIKVYCYQNSKTYTLNRQ